MIGRYEKGPGEHRIFRGKYSTKNCFDEVEIRQNDNSTKSFFDEMVQKTKCRSTKCRISDKT